MSPTEIAQALANAARKMGSPDDITVLLIPLKPDAFPIKDSFGRKFSAYISSYDKIHCFLDTLRIGSTIALASYLCYKFFPEHVSTMQENFSKIFGSLSKK